MASKRIAIDGVNLSFPRTRANGIVLASMLGTGAVIVVGELARGELPRPRRLLALGVVYVGLAAVATFAPPVAAPAALLVLGGTVLARGQDAAQAVTKAVGSRAPLGARTAALAISGAVPALAAGVNRAAGHAGDTAGPAGPVAPGSGPVGPPVPIRGRLIGTPHAGTHTLGNWQSDNAIDIAVPVGTPIVAVADGVIEKVAGGWSGGVSRFDGYQITLAGAGNRWFYTHLSTRTVRPGDRVRRGQVIGLGGAASGVAHLHIGQERGNPLDTLGYR